MIIMEVRSGDTWHPSEYTEEPEKLWDKMKAMADATGCPVRWRDSALVVREYTPSSKAEYVRG